MAPPITKEQKILIVRWFLETNSPVVVQRRFRKEFNCRHAPDKTSIKQYVRQFNATGRVEGKPKGGSKPRVRNAEVVEDIRSRIVDSPTKKSLRRLSRESGVSVTTTWRILHQEFNTS